MLLNGHVRAILTITAAFIVAGGSVRVGRRDDAGAVAGALGTLRAIHSAQEAFAAQCAPGRYAVSLDGLVTAPKGASTGFLSPGFPVSTSGYTVSLERGSDGRPLETASCNGAAVVSSYFVHAEPQAGVGGPSFAMNEHGSIYVRPDGRPISPGFEGAEMLP